MAHKVRISEKKNNVVRRKKRISSLALKAKIFYYKRMVRRYFLNRPVGISISVAGLPLEQLAFLKDAESKGLITNVTWINSGSSQNPEDIIKYALLYLHSDDARKQGCEMIRGYDYAWIKIVLDRAQVPSRFSTLKYMSAPKFVEYIKSLGFMDIAGPKTLNKVISQARWLSDSNKLSFQGYLISMPEIKRRNSIALKFMEILNEM